MLKKAWTWDTRLYPQVEAVLTALAVDPDAMCDQLETAPGNGIVGKLLCVCAAAAIAREALGNRGTQPPEVTAALELLNLWIDDPTDERFDQICLRIFDEKAPDLDPHGVLWCALRTATSSVGFSEAGWALRCTWSAAADAGLITEQMSMAVVRELWSRSFTSK